ncbi:uncharacterized protein BDR25DRAFT_374247 [Lindgomyces ingoldianus]|uniref:Uncharacterized protein n=1 Tax=Lindgomyces ingoldianus TaxID=673940 RepID=A0ACB6QM29_9PLEO|nr:uncharacterized protein BDR25DRAFT_374247 [Lindgomyces ingoldianus]KAF2467927.1 hypothetical protein BDR25DRAFT_374247 [Lindgomyces ingoldianus]
MVEASRELKLSCHCGTNTHTFTVPLSSLPLPAHFCNCNISRRISGSLLTSYISLPSTSPTSPNPDLSALTPYKSSDILTRYFCTTCGTHMYLEYASDGHFEAATGTLIVESTDGIVDFKAHIWVEDTPDGGASNFITAINGNPLPRYLREPDQSEEAPLSFQLSTTITHGATGSIRAHCHCTGTQFFIHPPNPSSKTASSSYPDLLVPYHSGSPANPQNYPWWLPYPTRYLAGTCTCVSCRRCSGFDITFWAFIPTCNISLDSAGTIPFSRNPYWGTMKTYRSSGNVTRTFCSVCGANVFWDGDARQSIVDVAVGLLDAGSGALAQELLAWWPGRVSFCEEGINKGLVGGLEEGLRDWAERRKGEGFVATGTFPVV